MPKELTQEKPAQPIEIFRGQMDRMAEEFTKVLPPHMTPDKLYRTVITSVQNQPKLLQADRNSLFAAIMTSAALGLEVDGVTGQGYLVPFKGQVTFIPGYKGYVTLALNSGFILEGHVVKEADTFDYQLGSKPFIHHAPAFGTDRGGTIGAYAVARSNNVPEVMAVLDLSELHKVRDNSAGYKAMKNRSPWATDFDAMAKKTAIRRLGANMPLNVQRLAAIETAADDGGIANIDAEGDMKVINPEGEDDVS